MRLVTLPGQLVCVAAFLAAAHGAVAAPAPSWELVDPASGRAASVAAGAPALHVVFLATWCTPCLAEIERLAELDARWGQAGYRLVLVAVSSRHTAERLARFRDERHVPGQLLFDADGSAQRAAGVERLPTHLVYDASGREVLRAGAFDDGVAGAVESLMTARGRGAGR